MSAANRSSELRLYASEDVTANAKKVLLQASNANFAMSGPQNMKFDFASFQITDSAGGSYYNVDSRFNAVESSLVANNAANSAAAAAVAVDLAAETVARQAQDTVLGNNISGEISARATAVQAVASALDVQEAKQVADLTASNASVAGEISNRQTADSAEAALRVAGDAALAIQISTLIGASTPAALQNLTAIVNAFQGADTTHTAQLASLITRMNLVESHLNELINSGL
jgi:hypothetical protein